MTTTLAIITIVISSISIVISALLVRKQISLVQKQIKNTYEWNVRKTSQETLKDLITGEFPKWRDEIELDFGCRIPNHKENYEVKITELEPEKKRELDFVLGRLLNMLEVVCINVKNKVVDEEIIYDYLGFILIEYRRWSDPFIEITSQGDPRFLGSLKMYAEKWSERFKEEQRKMEESGSVKGKEPL